MPSISVVGLSGGDLSGGGFGGDLGANGDVANTTVNSGAHVDEHVRTPQSPKVTAPTKVVENVNGRAVTTATCATSRVAATTATLRPTLERDITHIIVVPAIPDDAARRVAIYDAGIAPVAYADAPAYADNQYQVLQHGLRGTGVEAIRHGQQIVPPTAAWKSS